MAVTRLELLDAGRLEDVFDLCRRLPSRSPRQ